MTTQNVGGEDRSIEGIGDRVDDIMQTLADPFPAGIDTPNGIDTFLPSQQAYPVDVGRDPLTVIHRKVADQLSTEDHFTTVKPRGASKTRFFNVSLIPGRCIRLVYRDPTRSRIMLRTRSDTAYLASESFQGTPETTPNAVLIGSVFGPLGYHVFQTVSELWVGALSTAGTNVILDVIVEFE